MLRSIICRVPRRISYTSPLLVKQNKTRRAAVAGTAEEVFIDEVSMSDDASSTPVEESYPSEHEGEAGSHILPQAILKDLLSTVSVGQKHFLFGTGSEAGDMEKDSLRATGNFFDSINTAYEGKMLQEQQVEVENYVMKRRGHYTQRLNEETEEFRREQKEIHDEIHRIETQKYKNELISDIAHFTRKREAEYEAHLSSDVEKYYMALLAYHAQLKKSGKSSGAISDLTKSLTMNVLEAVEEMESEAAIRDFGNAAGVGNDLTDKDIRSYVVQRASFYEKCVQDEVRSFTQRRKAFYEELLEARAVRHAAKIRVDTEKFRQERRLYYDDRLSIDGSWMTKCFHEHYSRCFLQSYARKAWVSHRRYEATQEGIKIFTEKGEKIPAIPNPSEISITALNTEIPLSQVLDTYENENMTEVTRDVFLKAARRVAEEGFSDAEPDFPRSK